MRPSVSPAIPAVVLWLCGAGLSCSEPSGPRAACGNGLLDEGEVCDDGNAVGGAFAAARVFESRAGYTGEDPRSLALGDLDGDGAVDVVVANDDSNRITVLAGLGDGLLAPSQTLPTWDQPMCLAAGDLDLDGRLDIALVVYSDYVQGAILGPSGEATTAAYWVGSYGDSPTAVALGALDADRDLDAVVAADSDDGTVVMPNDGSGGFGGATRYTMADAIAHVALADLTGSGHLDMIAASPTTNTVVVRPGTGTGTFGGPSSLGTSVSTSGRGPLFVAVADVNDDLHLDVLTANSTSNDVTLFIGLGSGSFASPIIVPAVFDPAAAEVSCVRVGHFNDDGIPDIATANAARDTVSVMLGFGDGAFAAPQSFAVGRRPRAIAVADFDGDGLDDIAAADRDDDTVTVVLGLGHR